MSHNLDTEELLALLRDASLSPASIAEEMECAGAPGCAQEQLVRARELLAHLDNPNLTQESTSTAQAIGALPELLAQTLLRAVAEKGNQEILRAAATGANKALAKEAKRELQRLKQKGVAVQELKSQGAPAFSPAPAQDAPACYASSIDAYGERAVWFARPGRTGVDLAQIVLSDVKGIISADALPLSRKSYREFVKRLPRGGLVTCAEVTPAHARVLIAEAEREGMRQGFAPPSGYNRALSVLGSAPESFPDPIADLDYGADGELPHQLAGAALFTDPLFAAWIPEEEPLASYSKRAEEISSSALYADDAAKTSALAEHAREAAGKYFTETRKNRYARRLREMAHLLRHEKRLDAARSALATARGLEAQAGFERLPFCEALFTHAAAALARKDAHAKAGDALVQGIAP